jgi:hypothetical protein
VRYVLLIYADETVLARELATPEGVRRHIEGLVAVVKEEADRLQPGLPLAPTATATTVRVREGEVLVTDGPFAETKEQLAGFFVLEAEDLDRAIEVAARMPVAAAGSVEVRPVAEEVAEAVARALGRGG